jgi:hypothetical protein
MRLKKLDGDELTNLDMVLAESYRASNKQTSTSCSEVTTSSQFGKIKMEDLEKIEVDKDRLGSNPVLVTYQASQLLNSTAPSIHGGFVDKLRLDGARRQTAEGQSSSSSSSSLAPPGQLKLNTPSRSKKLSDRDDAPGSPFDDSCDVDEPDDGKEAEEEEENDVYASMPLTARTSTALNKVLSFPVQSAPPLDAGDPYAIIRRLVKMVEMLQEEKEASRPSSSQPSANVEALQREITELRIENANM